MASHLKYKIPGYKTVIWGLFFLLIMSLAGCGEKKKSDEELVIGNWTQYRNRAYVLLIIHSKGVWDSSVRVADATSKIVKAKGNAKGSWHMEEGQLIFTVVESDIEEIWEKNNTSFFEIVALDENQMQLKEENGRVGEWKKTKTGKADKADGPVAEVISMPPYAVNLNKHSSNAKDRYFCLKMNLRLKEIMPGQEVPQFHPRARDAAVLFLSSLVYGDVSDFDRIKEQKLRLKDVLNPYMDGLIQEIEIAHVIIASSYTRVEEFIIEHTLGGTGKSEGDEASPEDGSDETPGKDENKDA